MKNLSIYLIFSFISLLMMNSFTPSHPDSWDENTPVYTVLFHLGEPKPPHYLPNFTEEQIQQGKEISLHGKMKGKSFVSKYFVCASCHNSVREDADLSVVDQESRLEYAAENKIPYLQSSTFWAMVNRESWYNDDYVKKYGDLVTKANKNLEESMQLCATVCSQGRRLDEEELTVLKAYFWSLQLKIKDLNLSEQDKSRIYSAYKDTSSSLETIRWIKSKYLQKSPATFTEAPSDKRKGYGLKGRPEKGELIFNLGCKHCHRPQGESDVVFPDSKATFRWFKKHLFDNSQLSIYHITRYGTYPQIGHSEYMPLYTQEKLSDQQIEDLRAFIEFRATE